MNYQIVIDGEISSWGYSKQYIRQQLASYKGKPVAMRISSLGGDLNHGLDIRQQLIDHGDVTVYLTGFVASAATVIAMGAKRICMSKYALFLVHKCSNFIDAWGYYNADEMAKLIEDLTSNKRENDKIDVVLAQMYANKCKKKVGDILEVLKRGEWLTADEALEYGFIDEIIEDSDDCKVNFTDDLRSKFNAYSLPMPAMDRKEESRQASQSMLSQILDAIKSLIPGRPAKEDSAADPAQETQPETVTENESQPEMKSVTAYTAIMACLAVASMTANDDGSVQLSPEQLQTLNDALAQLNADLADRDKTITDLTAQVEAMKKLPGDTTGSVKDDSVHEMTTEEIDKLINSL